MPLLGSHLSIAGGYYRAAEAAAALGMATVQIFTKNNNQWSGKPISDDDVIRFREAVAAAGLRNPCSHTSYLINLAAPDDTLWEKSVAAMIDELQRAERLGLNGVVVHPGAFTTSSEEAGIARIIAAIDRVHEATPGIAAEIWLETTAGQGSALGWKFEQLASMIAGAKSPERLGVCVDTCHLFAAGYELRTEAGYRETMKQLADTIGIERVRAFHLNDSKKGLGSRVDRHEHIGEGELGLEPFRFVLNDRRFAKLPMYLETEKGERDGEDLDAINLRTLQGLLKTSKPTRVTRAKD